jgi:hypothetical protein
VPRARNIKPSFFKNEELGSMPFSARLLFIGLWILADREGRLEDRPARIAGELFPYDRQVGAAEVDVWLSRLTEPPEMFIVRYVIGASRFIQISNFSKHQSPHMKEQASIIPASGENEKAPGMSGASIRQTPDMHPPGRCVAHLNPDVLNPDVLNPDSNTLSCPEPSRDDPKPPKVANIKLCDPAIREWFTEEFWPAYPRKDDVKNARRAAMKRANTETCRAEIMAGLKAQLPVFATRERNFVPLASTWLNGERWNDSAGSTATTAAPKPITCQICRDSGLTQDGSMKNCDCAAGEKFKRGH